MAHRFVKVPPLPDLPPIDWIGFAAVAWGSDGWKPWSKNTAWAERRIPQLGRGNRILTKNAEEKQELIGTMLMRSLHGKPKPQQQKPWWIALHVVAPNYRGDPANVVDICLDAVQKATGLNDRYARIYRVSCQVDRDDPGIMLWFGVER